MNKKFLFVLGAILVSLFVTGSVLACEPEQPDPPTCPDGYIEEVPPEWISEECSCPTIEYTYVWETWEWDWDSWEWVPVKRNEGPYFVTYNKSNDPHKCHRPSTRQLRNLGMSHRAAIDFTQNHPQWMNAECEGGYWTDPVCVPDHDYNIHKHQTADCDGYSRLINLYDGDDFVETLYSDSGNWTDPYTTESLTAMTFDVPSEYGEDVSFTELSEPENCLIVRAYKAHQAYLDNNCEGVKRVINLYEGPVGNPYQTLVTTLHNETTLFTKKYVAETIPAETIDVPSEYGEDYTFAAMEEPATCVVDMPSLSVGGCMMGASGPWNLTGYGKNSTAHWRLVRYGSGEILDLGVIAPGGSASAQTSSAGTWVKQFYNEDTGTWQQRGGTHVTATNQWPEQACPGTHDYSIRIIVKNDCDGWTRKVNLRDFGSWVEVLYIETGTWDDPYVLETEPGVTFDVPDQYGIDDVVFEDLHEPAECLVSLEHQVNLGLENTCEGWSITPTTANGTCQVTGAASGSWTDPYTTEQATTSYSCTWDDQFETTQTVTIDEPTDCLVTLGHDPLIAVNSDCRGWSVSLTDTEGGEITAASPGTSGRWNKKYKQETVTISITVTWPDGHSETFQKTAKEPASCVELRPVTNRPMWLLVGADGRLCMLFSDSHPSVLRQNQLCFRCDSDDWQAINAPCAGRIYDDGTDFGWWPCDSVVESFGFNAEDSRLWMDDLISVDNGSWVYKTCEEIGYCEE